MTTYPVSTAPAAKAWLFGQMQANLTADPDYTFELSYGTEETSIDSPDDQVWLGKTSDRIVTRLAFVGGMGADALQEEYDLTINISVYRAGADAPNFTTVTDDPAALAEARAWALLGVIETAQRTDPTMGGNVTTSRPGMSECDVDWDESGNGRVATLTSSIHCYSPI